MDRLQRFIDAQDEGYRIAYKEMKRGKKMSHWIWFVFPQLKGLGKSIMSDEYGLLMDEVRPYLQHPILSLRLRNICNVLLEHKNRDIVRIMGTELDVMKLQASMTLFDYYSPGDVFKEVLDAFFQGNKHEKTLKLIKYVQE